MMMMMRLLLFPPADISLPPSELEAMLWSCAWYRRAAAAPNAKRAELLRRLASVGNELAVRHMHDAQRESHTHNHTKKT